MPDPNDLNHEELRADYRPELHRGRSWVAPALGVLVAVVAGVFYYFWLQRQMEPPPAPPPVAEAPTEVPTPEPVVRYPIQRPEPEREKPLPPVLESDADVTAALGKLFDAETLKRYLNLDTIIRRIVVTVDNLPRDRIPQRYTLMQPVEGSFQTTGKDENLTINPDNTRRYAAYARLFEGINTSELVATYVYFYPLLQEEYKNIGSPKKYFNDRVVEAIDDMLAAPVGLGPIKLVQPKVFYQYADPKLESLSAGQKIMIRMGDENAAHVRAKLREIRAALVDIR